MAEEFMFTKDESKEKAKQMMKPGEIFKANSKVVINKISLLNSKEVLIRGTPL